MMMLQETTEAPPNLSSYSPWKDHTRDWKRIFLRPYGHCSYISGAQFHCYKVTPALEYLTSLNSFFFNKHQQIPVSELVHICLSPLKDTHPFLLSPPLLLISWGEISWKKVLCQEKRGKYF